MMGTFAVLTSFLLAGCDFGRHVDEAGKYSPLFPQTPLSDAPCIEDQDCVVTHLIDGDCCPAPSTSASNLYTKDQYEKLIEHQRVVCVDEQDAYTCPEHPPHGHIDYILQGSCVNQRCVTKKVPADAPHIPNQPLPTPNSDNTAVDPTDPGEPPGPIKTAASPKTD